MQAGGDGFGWRVTAEYMTFQNPSALIPRHICKIPERGETTGSTRTKKSRGGEDENPGDNLIFSRLMKTHMNVNGPQRSIHQHDVRAT